MNAGVVRSFVTVAIALLVGAANAGAPQPAPASAYEPKLEPKALEILKASCARLAAARTMQFSAVVYYENPSLLGPPLVYTTKSDVRIERPNKLSVITSGDGPPSEFYYDGKSMLAFAPQENLVAVATAPPSIDLALKEAYDSAAIYYPFADLIVADPYKDITDTAKFAFYIGQSNIVGGTTTDMVAYGDSEVFIQVWIGAADNLPYMMRAIYRNDPARLRHAMAISDWKLGVAHPEGTFSSTRSADAKKIKFARPDAKPPTAPTK